MVRSDRGFEIPILKGADALVIVTEWREFRSPNFDLIKSSLREPVVFDGRNIYEPELLSRAGIKYYAVGRGDSIRRILNTPARARPAR